MSFLFDPYFWCWLGAMLAFLLMGVAYFVERRTLQWILRTLKIQQDTIDVLNRVLDIQDGKNSLETPMTEMPIPQFKSPFPCTEHNEKFYNFGDEEEEYPDSMAW